MERNTGYRVGLGYPLGTGKKKRKGQLPMPAMVYFTTLSEKLQFGHPVDNIVQT